VALADSGAFAHRYIHAGMVRLDGEKMSKSLGNLVFVSGLLGGGADPMAVRLAVLAHSYGRDWDWTAAGLEQAQARLARWRAAVSRGLGEPGVHGAGASGTAVPDAASVLATVRERLADNLDAPGALAAVDYWATQVAGARVLPAGFSGDAAVVRDTVDALLGVALEPGRPA
jgi:L-cysteine:1D-myo-inositol 2-amino-2-deoxy-alpha-D-glucopyranoside ligase